MDTMTRYTPIPSSTPTPSMIPFSFPPSNLPFRFSTSPPAGYTMSSQPAFEPPVPSPTIRSKRRSSSTPPPSHSPSLSAMLRDLPSSASTSSTPKSLSPRGGSPPLSLSMVSPLLIKDPVLVAMYNHRNKLRRNCKKAQEKLQRIQSELDQMDSSLADSEQKIRERYERFMSRHYHHYKDVEDDRVSLTAVLPDNLLAHVLSFCDIRDVARFSYLEVCKRFARVIVSHKLWPSWMSTAKFSFGSYSDSEMRPLVESNSQPKHYKRLANKLMIAEERWDEGVCLYSHSLPEIKASTVTALYHPRSSDVALYSSSTLGNKTTFSRWDVHKKTLEHSIVTETDHTPIFSDSLVAVSSINEEATFVWSMEKDSYLGALTGHLCALTDKHVVTAAETDSELRVWSVGEHSMTFLAKYPGSTAASIYNNILMTSSSEGTVMWDLRMRPEEHALQMHVAKEEYSWLVLINSNRFVATNGFSDGLVVHDIRNQRKRTLYNSGGGVDTVEGYRVVNVKKEEKESVVSYWDVRNIAREGESEGGTMAPQTTFALPEFKHMPTACSSFREQLYVAEHDGNNATIRVYH